MGVTGLWRLIEPAGKPVPVETLENKVLAVDISIWLHQMVKGYQDAKGAPLPNAHLMGLFQRLCKLLYFRIKPVFVFDGGFPDLKKETIAKRQDHKAKYNSESERIKRELALLLSKKTALNSLLGKQISPKQSTSNISNNDDIFKLPALPQKEEDSEYDSEEETSSGSIVDLHSVDIESEKFKSMPIKEKYDLLIELKETRKMNSWGKLHELPKKSGNFSDFQMQRLLKRRKVHECLQETEKEMGDGGMSLNELESLLNDEGIDTKIDTVPTRRIASNNTTRFLLIKDVKQALAEAKKRKEEESKPSINKDEENVSSNNVQSTGVLNELEDDLQKAIKMSLECVDDQNTSVNTSKTDESWTSYMTDSDDAYSYDSEEEDGFQQPENFSSAKAYIMQYSDFTHKSIDKLVMDIKLNDKNKCKVPKVDQILEEINKEKSVIVDNVNLSSSDDERIQDDPHCSSEEFQSPVHNILDATQSSVVCVENPTQEIISLDISAEEINEITREPLIINNKQKSFLSDQEFVVSTMKSECNELITPNFKITTPDLSNTNSNKNESDSSDSDFEDVPEIENKQSKPVVELTLNMGDAPDDDIFADIFEKNNESVSPNAKSCNAVNLISQIDSESKIEQSKAQVYASITDSVDAHSKVNEMNTKAIKKISDKQEIVTDTREKSCSTIAIKNNLPTEKNKDNKHNLNEQSEAPNTSKKDQINGPPREVITTEQLTSLVEEMQNEEQDLLQEKGRLDRVGRNITEQMTKEAQELLQIFGIPYIVAPMEAEAQCAFLENANLTDGTITDDSDIWLFGGRTVYKNFFNQKKHVLQFLADRIEKSFNLSREQLVLLALLVGSDYTTGVTGVGPVTALEILASFPFNKRQLDVASKQARYTEVVKGLQEFKQWVRAGKRTDNSSLKKKLKNVALAEDFPSVRVVQAYLEPNVEKSDEKFTWGELDITILRDYTRSKFGWSQSKLDEIIKPVLKRMLDRKTQRSVQDYFKRKVEFQSLEEQMSKRVKAAVQRMGPGNPDDYTEIEEDKPARKRKAANAKSELSKNVNVAGPSDKLRKENETSVLDDHRVKIVSQITEGKTDFEIRIPKSDRFQEIIPQREKDKKSLLENKLKAIEVFRKTNIDKKRKTVKKKALQPKKNADLSESDSD